MGMTNKIQFYTEQVLNYFFLKLSFILSQKGKKFGV